jgi:hypothetical protein
MFLPPAGYKKVEAELENDEIPELFTSQEPFLEECSCIM